MHMMLNFNVNPAPVLRDGVRRLVGHWQGRRKQTKRAGHRQGHVPAQPDEIDLGRLTKRRSATGVQRISVPDKR